MAIALLLDASNGEHERNQESIDKSEKLPA
jgi:hypothetical protein